MFEIITTNIKSNFCSKNSVINYQGGYNNADNYPTFGDNNINDNGKYIIYLIKYNYSWKNEGRLQFNKKVY